jgi:hypothetical protein
MTDEERAALALLAAEALAALERCAPDVPSSIVGRSTPPCGLPDVAGLAVHPEPRAG